MESILSLELFDQRNAFFRMFDQQGDWMSPAFVPAAQQDLITLTLEILARDPVVEAAPLQRKAFSDTFTLLETKVTVQAPNPEHMVLSEAQPNIDYRSKLAKAANSVEMVKLALEPVFQALSSSQSATPLAVHTSPPQIPVPQNVSTNETPW